MVKTKQNVSINSTRSNTSKTSSVRKPRKPNKPQKNRNIFKVMADLQRSDASAIPRLPFARLVRECLEERSKEVNRVTLEALKALQEATEIYMMGLLEDSYRITVARNKVTLQIQDIRLCRMLRRDYL